MPGVGSATRSVTRKHVVAVSTNRDAVGAPLLGPGARLLPAHVQPLDMESNGKRATRGGDDDHDEVFLNVVAWAWRSCVVGR